MTRKDLPAYFSEDPNFMKRLKRLERELKGKNIEIAFSGGIDSTSAIVVMKELGAKKIKPYFVNRGQSNLGDEKKAVFSVLHLLSKQYEGVESVHLTDLLSKENEEAKNVVLEKTDIPTHRIKQEYGNSEIGNASIKNRYWGRNLEILNLLLRDLHCRSDKKWGGFKEKYEIAATGSVITDESFGDGSPEFYRAMNHIITAINGDNDVKVIAPFIRLQTSKSESAYLVLSMNPDIKEVIEATYSCWNAEGPCGKCIPDLERKKVENFLSEQGLEVSLF